jgi:hypothetical protein
MLKEASKKYYQAILHQEDKLFQQSKPKTEQGDEHGGTGDDNESSDAVTEEQTESDLVMEYYRGNSLFFWRDLFSPCICLSFFLVPD